METPSIIESSRTLLIELVHIITRNNLFYRLTIIPILSQYGCSSKNRKATQRNDNSCMFERSGVPLPIS